MKQVSLCLLLALLIGSAGSLAAEENDYESFFGLKLKAKKQDAPDKKKEEGKAFSEVIADCDTLSGLFPLYHNPKNGELWMEVLPDQLDRDFILSNTMESGAGGQGLVAGLPAGHHVIRISKVGDKLRVVKRNLKFRAAGMERSQWMVERSVSDHPLLAVKLPSRPEKDRKSFLLPMHKWLLKDPLHLAKRVGRALGSEFNHAKEHAHFTLMQSFPGNVELGVRQTFTTRKPKRGWSLLADPRVVELESRFSLSELPETDYQSRLADDRVGYFQTLWRQWGDDGLEDPHIRVVNRWNLQKKDPDLAISEPVEPIVYWLEDAIPEEYRAAVRKGAELWNIAFEEAGFSNAFVVKQMPDDADWDPADIRYNTIRWISSSEPMFGAMGPSQVNPWTGEILNADILIEADMVRRVAWNWRASVAPLGHNLSPGSDISCEDLPQAGEGLLAALDAHGDMQAELWADCEHEAYPCRASQALAAQVSQAGMLLVERGELKSGDPLPWKLVEQYLVALVAHEVGHTLGLRHNFAGSNLNTYEQLWDKERTSRLGLVSSVMEYDPACVALDPKQQGWYFTPTLGPYDRFAIRWGYTPMGAADPVADAQKLQPLLELADKDPQLRYATDDDAYDVRGWGSAVDPTVRVFDMCSEEDLWAEHQLAVARIQLAMSPDDLLKEGDEHFLYRQAWQRAFSGYWNALRPLPRYVGAMHLSRKPYGAGEAPLEVWEAEEQRELLSLLLKNMLDNEPWYESAERLELMGHSHRYTVDNSRNTGRLDLPLRSQVVNQRARLLAELYSPRRLARTVELESRHAGTLSQHELFTEIREHIWKNAADNGYERDIQEAHAGLLMELMLDRKLRHLPRDSKLLARADLKVIRGRIRSWAQQKRLRSPEDSQHLFDLAERIDLALDRERNKL